MYGLAAGKSEPQVMRHFVRLSTHMELFHRPADFFPLGSCTMKHNPSASMKRLARLKGFASISIPMQPDPAPCRGHLKVMYDLAKLAGGVDRFACGVFA